LTPTISDSTQYITVSTGSWGIAKDPTVAKMTGIFSNVKAHVVYPLPIVLRFPFKFATIEM
jgi:hypothetical protein